MRKGYRYYGAVWMSAFCLVCLSGCGQRTAVAGNPGIGTGINSSVAADGGLEAGNGRDTGAGGSEAGADRDTGCLLYTSYVAEARVIHSHNYGCMAQFHRNFDLAVSQADHPEVFQGIHSESEGIRLVKQTARYLVKQRRPWLVPGMIVKSGFKYMGYRLGRCYRLLPSGLAAKCSMNKEYWK